MANEPANPEGAASLDNAASLISGFMAEPLVPPASEDRTPKANPETPPAKAEETPEETPASETPPAGTPEETPPEGAEEEEPDETPDEDETPDGEPAEEPDEPYELPETLAALAEEIPGMDEKTLLSTLKTTIKVNGETTEVTLAELRDGHQMEKDYRVKTAQLSKEKQEFETVQTQVAGATQQWLNEVTGQLQAAEALFEGQVEAIDMDTLFEMDPAYHREVSNKIQATRKQYDEQKQGLGLHFQQHNAHVSAKALEHRNAELVKLGEVWPEFVDPVKGAETRQVFQDKAELHYGLTRNDLDAIGDHRAFSVMQDAIAYRELKAQAPATRKKLTGKPKYLKSGTPKPKGQAQRDQAGAAISNHRKTQTADSAAAALRKGGFA